MSVSPPDSEAPQKQSRRFRFGLRTMFAMVTLCAILFGGLWKIWWEPWQAQWQAVAQMNMRVDVGGMGSYRHESMDEFPWWKKKLGAWLGRDSVARVTRAYSETDAVPVDISVWRGLGSVERVGFDRAVVHDLSPLKDLKQLKHFSCFQSRLTANSWYARRPNFVMPEVEGMGLEILGQCKRLERVRMLDCSFKFNDQVLDSICNAENIRYFAFGIKEVNDLSPLARLKNLEDLYIYLDRPVDLGPIGQIPNLKLLCLDLSTDPSQLALTFPQGLKHLEKLEIDGYYELSKQQRETLSNSVPKGCEVFELTWGRPVKINETSASTDE